MQIDKRTHTRQRDRIREAIGDAEVELSDSAVEQIDVDGIMGFAETVLQNAAKLWKQSGLNAAPATAARTLPGRSHIQW